MLQKPISPFARYPALQQALDSKPIQHPVNRNWLCIVPAHVHCCALEAIISVLCEAIYLFRQCHFFMSPDVCFCSKSNWNSYYCGSSTRDAVSPCKRIHTSLHSLRCSSSTVPKVVRNAVSTLFYLTWIGMTTNSTFLPLLRVERKMNRLLCTVSDSDIVSPWATGIIASWA